MSDDCDDDELEGEPCPFCAEPNHHQSDTRCIRHHPKNGWPWQFNLYFSDRRKEGGLPNYRRLKAD